MNKIMNLFTIILISIIKYSVSSVEGNKTDVTTETVTFSMGLKTSTDKDDHRITNDVDKLLGENALLRVDHETDHGEKEKNQKPDIMQRLGTFLMMIPIVMQLFSLPAAIASIKMSLIKSILVAKLAIFIIVFNWLRNLRQSETVIVHQPAPQHFNHYYSPYEEEEEDKGWFG